MGMKFVLLLIVLSNATIQVTDEYCIIQREISPWNWDIPSVNGLESSVSDNKLILKGKIPCEEIITKNSDYYELKTRYLVNKGLFSDFPPSPEEIEIKHILRVILPEDATIVEYHPKTGRYSIGNGASALVNSTSVDNEVKFVLSVKVLEGGIVKNKEISKILPCVKFKNGVRAREVPIPGAIVLLLSIFSLVFLFRMRRGSSTYVEQTFYMD